MLTQCWRNYLFSGIIFKQEIPENVQNFKNSYQFNRSSDWHNLYMKNYQKNSIYPSVPFSCMTNQPIHAVYTKAHLWHLKGLILELHLNLWFKWISSKLNAKCIGSKHITYSCHIHASYCCIWLCFDCRHRSLSIGPAPESVPEYLSEEQCHPVDLPGKQTPFVHSDTILLSRFCSLLLH